MSLKITFVFFFIYLGDCFLLFHLQVGVVLLVNFQVKAV